MFFKKKPITEPKLIDVVTKKIDTGFVFWNISDDLGHSAEAIISSNPKVIMAYAYASRVAAASLYVQGLMNKDAYGHAVAFFKGVQQKIGGAVEFQEAAADYSTEFMQSYCRRVNNERDRRKKTSLVAGSVGSLLSCTEN